MTFFETSLAFAIELVYAFLCEYIPTLEMWPTLPH